VNEPETITEQYEHWVHDPAPNGGESHDRQAVGGITPQTVAEQLSSLLLTADGAARSIVEEAEAKATEQLAEVERRVRWMEAETAKMASWSRQTEEMIRALSSAVGSFRKDVEAVPQRISEALNPLASHVPHLVRQMNDLVSALSPPAPQEEAEDNQPAEPNWVEGWDDPQSGTG
jgi:septal ring factor EnvC (AmiA/AmiB activator)